MSGGTFCKACIVTSSKPGRKQQVMGDRSSCVLSNYAADRRACRGNPICREDGGFAWPCRWRHYFHECQAKFALVWHHAWLVLQVHAKISLKRYRLVSRVGPSSHGHSRNYS